MSAEGPKPGHMLPVILATVTPQAAFDACMKALVIGQQPTHADVLVVQQSARVADQVRYWETEEPFCGRVTVHRPGHNMGTCAAWNHGLRWAFARGYSEALILNDDVVLTEAYTCTMLLDMVRCQPRQLRWLQHRGFSAILVTRAVVEDVGWFDEGFWPAYFEDNDYHHRTKLAKVPWDDVDIPTEHTGSGTLKADPEISMLNGTAFGYNSARYHAKWGGGPHHEQWDVPWNGGEPWRGVRDALPPNIRTMLDMPYGPAVPA